MICSIRHKFIKNRADQKLGKVLKKEKKDFMIYWLKEMNLEYSSHELLASGSFSDHFLSCICLSICLSVNFLFFDYFSTTTGQIFTKLFGKEDLS